MQEWDAVALVAEWCAMTKDCFPGAAALDIVGGQRRFLVCSKASFVPAPEPIRRSQVVRNLRVAWVDYTRLECLSTAQEKRRQRALLLQVSHS